MGKKVAIIGVSSIFLVAMVVAAVMVGVNRKAPAAADTDSSKSVDATATAKAVQTLCQPTDYKEACERSLASANTIDQKELMQLAFKAAMHEVTLALQNSTELTKANTDPLTAQSLKTCNVALDLAIDHAQKSIDKLGAVELSKVDEYLNDVQTWLSSTYSYGVMCIDSFQWNAPESNKVKAEMEKALKSYKELTSNALAMVNQIESVMDLDSQSTPTRRLLSEDGLPTWVNPSMRRLLQAPAINIKPHVIVAKDGSGKYKTVSEAVKNIPVRENNATYVIYIKAGVYNEIVTIEKKKTHVMMIGDGPDKTKITGSLNRVDNAQTFDTPTVKVFGHNFIARNMGFENTAGSKKGQAVALRVDGDQTIIYNCRIDGFQDTLLTSTNRQFYRDCVITGTIDFIFGYGSAVLQNCKLLIRKPLPGQSCVVTADGREIQHQLSGIIIHNSIITAAPDMEPVKHNFKSYLGRPWGLQSRTIVIRSEIDDVIDPEGWAEWQNKNHHTTCLYGEFRNTGKGADRSKRVGWSKNLTETEAIRFRAAKFINGNSWIPMTGVPFIGRL